MVNLRNWNGIGRLFEFTVPELLENSIDDAVAEAERVYSNSIREVLAEQPSDWTPKSHSWAAYSGSTKLFFGKERDFAAAVSTPGKNSRGLRAKRGDRKVFVGARHDITHHSGYSVATLAEILQATPDGSRDLFERAYERVDYEIMAIFRRVGIDLH